MEESQSHPVPLSVWWHRSVVLVFVVGMAVLGFMSLQAYRHAPPIPDRVVDADGLMQNGSIWGHGAYLGPDFSARYLHELSMDAGDVIARQKFNARLADLDSEQRLLIDGMIPALLKENRYNPETHTLTFLESKPPPSSGSSPSGLTISAARRPAWSCRPASSATPRRSAS